MKFTAKQIWDACIAAALMFVPLGIRWAVRITADQFASKSKNLPAGALDQTAVADAPEGLKEIVQALFDGLAEQLDGRPFLQSAVRAVGNFVVKYLLDLVFDLLTTQGTRAKTGAVPMHYDPKGAESLEAELAAAVALDS